MANVHGPQAGIEAVESIPDQEPLQSYYLLYAVLAEFEAQLNHLMEAADHLRKALKLVEQKSEQSFLSKQLRDYEKRGGSRARPVDVIVD